MKKEVLKELEKLYTLEEEVINEYNRLREKNTNFGEKMTVTDIAQLTLLEHLVNNFILQIGNGN